MKPRDQAIRELEENGYRFKRHGGAHDIYYSQDIKCTIPVKRHKFTENALQYIRKEIKQNKSKRG